MYMCVRDVDHASVSMMFQLDFGTVPTVWYFRTVPTVWSFDFHFATW